MPEEVFDPLALAQEAYRLRTEAKVIEDRLTEIAAILSAAEPQVWVADGFRFRARTSNRKTFTFDEGKLRVADPDVFGRCTKLMVDASMLKSEIAAGTAKHWMKYSQYTQGKPYVTIIREEAE